MVPNEIARGGHGGVNMAVLVAILSHGVCWASIETLAKEAGVNAKSVRKAIKYWVDRGVINRDAKNGMTSVLTPTVLGTRPLPNLAGGGLPKTAAKEDPYKKNIEERETLALKDGNRGGIIQRFPNENDPSHGRGIDAKGE